MAERMRLRAGKDSEGQALPEGFREPLRFKPTISDKEDDWLVRRAGDLSLDDLVFVRPPLPQPVV